MTLGDGVERGMRMLEFRTGTGLRFTVLVDRAFDIADCEYAARRSAGIRRRVPPPGLHEYEGEGGLAWLRSFSGLMVTCGLDHILFMDDGAGRHYVYGPRKTVASSLHGRIGTIPARLTGYGERWDGDECTLWCEGIVQQAAVFGEDLHLVRRIEAKVGVERDPSARPRRQPRLLPDAAHVTATTSTSGIRCSPRAAATWRRSGRRRLGRARGEEYRRQGVGYRTLPGPQRELPRAGLAARDGRRRRRARPRGAGQRGRGGRGFGFQVETRKDEFPCQFEWQNLQAGQYALGHRAVDATTCSAGLSPGSAAS